MSLTVGVIAAAICIALNFDEQVVGNSEFKDVVGHDIIEVRYGFPIWAHRMWPLIFVGKTEWNSAGIAIDIAFVLVVGACALVLMEIVMRTLDRQRGKIR